MSCWSPSTLCEGEGYLKPRFFTWTDLPTRPLSVRPSSYPPHPRLHRRDWECQVTRIFLGIGEAFNAPACYALITLYFPMKKRATANGIYSTGTYLGSAISSLCLAIAGYVGEYVRGIMRYGAIISRVSFSTCFLLLDHLHDVSLGALLRPVSFTERTSPAGGFVVLLHPVVFMGGGSVLMGIEVALSR